MRLGRLAVLPPVLAMTTLSGCKKETPAPAPAPAPAPVAARPPAPPPSAISGKSLPDCVGPFTTQGETGELTIDGHAYKRAGATLSAASPDADHQTVLGVLGSFREASAENLLAWKKYEAFFKEEKIEALLVDGDSGDTAEDIKASLETIAQVKVPVLVIPGNREPRADFQKALAEVQKKDPNVINMSQVRLVNLDDASVVSLPGYYDRRFIIPEAAGCQYFKEDVDGLAPIIAAATNPVVLLSHAEPRGTSKDALDAFSEGNAGDQALATFLQAHPVPFGVFANMQEAGGRATDLASNVIKPGEEKPQVYLNPGAADTTGWPLNDGTKSFGMVATLKINEGKGSYKVYRAPQLTEAELAQARKAEPVKAEAPAPTAPKEATAGTKP